MVFWYIGVIEVDVRVVCCFTYGDFDIGVKLEFEENFKFGIDNEVLDFWVVLNIGLCRSGWLNDFCLLLLILGECRVGFG